jgi:hypothetical protein
METAALNCGDRSAFPTYWYLKLEFLLKQEQKPVHSDRRR